jgi:hypothetical protein
MKNAMQSPWTKTGTRGALFIYVWSSDFSIFSGSVDGSSEPEVLCVDGTYVSIIKKWMLTNVDASICGEQV